MGSMPLPLGRFRNLQLTEIRLNATFASFLFCRDGNIHAVFRLRNIDITPRETILAAINLCKNLVFAGRISEPAPRKVLVHGASCS